MVFMERTGAGSVPIYVTVSAGQELPDLLICETPQDPHGVASEGLSRTNSLGIIPRIF
jgi:hypothetical protein